MTAEHFRELVDTIRLTRKGTSLQEIAKTLHISPNLLSAWKRLGVPNKEAKYVGLALRKFMREGF